MAASVTYQFYSETYGDGLSEAAFGLVLPAAERHVRWLCGGRFPSRCEMAPYKRAVCAAADAFAEFGEGQVGGFRARRLQGDALRGRGHDRRGDRHGRCLEGAGGNVARVLRGAVMRSLRPIPARLLGDDAVVRVLDGAGGYTEGVVVSHVRFCKTQSVADDDHRSADAGAGKVYVDALNSVGALEVPAGSRIDIGGHSYYVAECKRCEDFNGHVHHWELTVR